MKAKKYQHALAAYLVRFFQPKQGFLLESHSESPAGAGISGSSAMMICTSAALARFVGRDIDIEQIRVIAQNVEAQLIRVPTGCQDYYPAMYGGVNAIHLDPDGIHCEPIAIPAEEMNKRFVLFYTGAPRQSGINNWEVFKQHINGDKHVIRNFAEISRIAQEMHRALKHAKWDDVERLLHEEWKLRRTNAPGITTPLIDKLIAAARKQGARAAKVCGAGGGGCVVAFVEEGSRERVHEAIRKNGGQPLDFQVARHGLRFHGPSPGHRQGDNHVHRRRRTAAADMGVCSFSVAVVCRVFRCGLSSLRRLPAIMYCALRPSFGRCWRRLLLAIFSWLLTRRKPR